MVCAQFGSISFHLRITDIETETLVKQTDHEGCIGRISERDAPILLILRNPRMPKVDGKTHANPCQKPGILLSGHETPVIKSNGTEVNTTRSITFSRYLTRHDSIRPKKTHIQS